MLWSAGGRGQNRYTEDNMKRVKKYILLHLNILLFSFTSIFSKLASIEYNKSGLYGWKLYLYIMLMLTNCFIYAIAWQKVIKKFDLTTAYANRSVYLIWSQIWAVLIFHEQLSATNILGIGIVFIGVLVVQSYE